MGLDYSHQIVRKYIVLGAGGSQVECGGPETRGNGKTRSLCLLLKCHGRVNGFLYFLGRTSTALARQQLEGRDCSRNGPGRPRDSSFYCAKQKKLLLINPLQFLVGKIIYHPIS